METMSQVLQPSLNYLEPIHKLAPYLNNLNGANFCDEFEKFADLILTSSPSPSPSLSPSLSLSLSPSSNYSTDDQYQQQQQQQYLVNNNWPSSPSPSYNGSGSSSTGSSSSLPSPLVANNYGSSSSPEYSYSFSSSSSPFLSSPNSSYPTSSAGSICDDEQNHSYQTTTTIQNNRARKRGDTSGSRKLRNASAAERYRRKIKGRRCSLADQLHREQERNAQLRREISSKLVLYSEFVELLAKNTGENDQVLASLGVKSLATVLNNVIITEGEEEYKSNNLINHLEQFRKICQH